MSTIVIYQEKILEINHYDPYKFRQKPGKGLAADTQMGQRDESGLIEQSTRGALQTGDCLCIQRHA